MKSSLFTIVTAAVLVATAGLAAAQTSTTSTTTWTNDEGTQIREYSTSKKYSSFNDPALKASVGTQLPDNVTLYPLPETVKVSDGDHYSYSIINDHPVVVETTTRKIVHNWD